ncbi:hypothetical protein MACJ_001940 [Theileria orientalis]|uniref:Uncharacterized protein n=1 Tax=Theileria orientalis TaxID=68886 RepID=A0A976QS96_THEOR|nr:hypothetical protein MACJ_001940 [Theileria orientalis]
MVEDITRLPSKNVLFKWDPRSHSTCFDTQPPTDDSSAQSRDMELNKHNLIHELLHNLDENENEELSRSFKDSTTEGLNMNPDLLSKGRDKRAELVKNLKKIQLHSSRDWLGLNSSKSSLKKVDTLDRLSSVIMNPEFPMKHEAVLYSIQLGKSDYEFYNALFVTKLSRMSNISILELIRQPVFVRNRIIVLTDRKTCKCPLSVLTRHQPQHRHFLHQGAPLLQKPLTPNHPYTPQGGFGDAFFNRFVSPQSALMPQKIFTGERSYANLFGLDRKWDADRMCDYIDDNDIVCPFHEPMELPESLKCQKGLCGVIEYYNLYYKYEERKVDNKNSHVLSFCDIGPEIFSKEPEEQIEWKLSSSKVFQYKLPSKLLAINHVYLRDFEYERYYSTSNMYNSSLSEEMPVKVENGLYLSNLYSGDALFMVTKTEIIIALIHMKKSTELSKDSELKLGVILRDSNHRIDVKEVLSHRETGRIFMLESSSLLYEYQYQLGLTPTSLKDHKAVRYLYNTLRYTKHMLFDVVKSKRTYNLSTSHPEVLLNERRMDADEYGNELVHERRRNVGFTERWEADNCLDSMESSVTNTKCYYPPLQWKEITQIAHSKMNIFRSGEVDERREPSGGFIGIARMFRREPEMKETCRCGFGCRVEGMKRNLKCINPWNKKLMKTGESTVVIDQNRWTLSLLNTTSGDLSVFYLHGYTSVEEYTTSLPNHERVFPYDLTLYNLKHGNIISSLERLGYNRFSFGARFVKIMAAPLDFVQGVDLILVDNNGVKVFIGFSNSTLTTQTSLITTSLATNLSANLTMDTIKINALNEKATSNPSKIELAVKGYRMPYRQVGSNPRGPFALFRSKSNVTTFLLDSTFITIEPVRKLQNGTLVRIVATKNDSSSYFQSHTTLPLSINEEFYIFNENAVQYRTFEENQPVEYYHEFYIMLDDKEKIVTAYHWKGRTLYDMNESLYNRWEKYVENEAQPDTRTMIEVMTTSNEMNGVMGRRNEDATENHRLGTRGPNGRMEMDLEGKQNVDNLLYIVTTERVYVFNMLNESLLLKSLIKYPKSTLALIRPPPLLNGNTYVETKSLPEEHAKLGGMFNMGGGPLFSFEPGNPLITGGVRHNNNLLGNLQRQRAMARDPNSNVRNESDERGLIKYLIRTIDDNPQLEGLVDSSTSVRNIGHKEYGKRDVDEPEGLNRYLSRMNRGDTDEDMFRNVFGDDMEDLCENSNEIIGYSLYYMSWLYGPENMFKKIFNYLVDKVVNYVECEMNERRVFAGERVLRTKRREGLLTTQNGMEDMSDVEVDAEVEEYLNSANPLVKPGIENTISIYNAISTLSRNRLDAECSHVNGNSTIVDVNTGSGPLMLFNREIQSELNLSTLTSDILYSYVFTNHVEGYNAFIASFGIPYKIFNYVAPGCYSVCEDGFERPVISPWCKFVSFSNNKVKRNRVVTNTTPLVDGLLLLISELLTPMYYNRMFNIVPHMYTSQVTNPVFPPPDEGEEFSRMAHILSRMANNGYVMDGLKLNRFDNVNEFVVGERVDMYLTLELSMGLERSKKLLEKLYTLSLLVDELVLQYENCNLENVVQIMSTLAPNVVRMMLSPNVNQHEPYPPSQTTHSYGEPSITNTTVNDFYNAGDRHTSPHSSSSGDTTKRNRSPKDSSQEAYWKKRRNDSRPGSSAHDPKRMNRVLLSLLESLIRERYDNDIRTLKELATVLQVSQEFIASALLLHNNAVLGDCNYEFDKMLDILHLLPTKTPKSFFSPHDFSLNWASEKKFLFPYSAKFTYDSPKSKLILTKTLMNLMSQSNLINLFMNKEFLSLYRVIVWLVGENASEFQRHFYGHLFSSEEIDIMSSCNRVKYLQRQLDNADDLPRAQYIQTLIKQFTGKHPNAT